VRNRLSVLVLSLLALAALSAASPAHPSTRSEEHAQGELAVEAQAGYDGVYKLASWVPVHVTVTNNGQDIKAEIEVTMPTESTTPVRYTTHAVLPHRSRKRYTVYAFVDSYVRELQVRVTAHGAEIASLSTPIRPLTGETALVGVLSTDPIALAYLAGLPQTGSYPIHVAHLSLPNLPAYARALMGVDALIVHDVDTQALAAAQRLALRGWIAGGGHLAVCGGPAADWVADGLDDLVPVEVLGSRTTTEIGALGSHAHARLARGCRAHRGSCLSRCT